MLLLLLCVLCYTSVLPSNLYHQTIKRTFLQHEKYMRILWCSIVIKKMTQIDSLTLNSSWFFFLAVHLNLTLSFACVYLVSMEICPNNIKKAHNKKKETSLMVKHLPKYRKEKTTITSPKKEEEKKGHRKRASLHNYVTTSTNSNLFLT